MPPDTTTDKAEFLGSDAWLLAAVYEAGRDGAEPTLARVIGIGDAINHAIFTLAELNGGLGRLERAGLVSVHGNRFELTRLGRRVAEKDPAVARGAFRHVETLRERLGASQWLAESDPNDARDPGNPKVYVSEEAFRIAVDENRRLFRSR